MGLSENSQVDTQFTTKPLAEAVDSIHTGKVLAK